MNAVMSLPLWNVIKQLYGKDNNMENLPTVSIKPDKEERKRISLMYGKAALVIIINMVLYNIVFKYLFIFILGIIGGGFSSLSEMVESAGSVLENDDISTVCSCLIPILSESISIFIGIKLLKLDLKKLFTFNGFTGKELARDCSVCLGLQTFAALIAALITFILSLFNLKSATADLSAQNNSAWSLIFMYFYACLLGPLLEELLYRGVLLQGMRKYNERFAVVLSALIFGLMHQNYQQFILAFMVGLVFAAVDLRAGSIIPSVVIHIIVNTSGLLAQLAMQSADFEAFSSVAAGDANAALSGSAAFMLMIALNAIFRYGFMFLGIILLIMIMTKGRTVRRPTPAGKSRGLPILLRSPLWYIVILAYIYLCFIQPISVIK